MTVTGPISSGRSALARSRLAPRPRPSHRGRRLAGYPSFVRVLTTADSRASRLQIRLQVTQSTPSARAARRSDRPLPRRGGRSPPASRSGAPRGKANRPQLSGRSASQRGAGAQHDLTRRRAGPRPTNPPPPPSSPSPVPGSPSPRPRPPPQPRSPPD